MRFLIHAIPGARSGMIGAWLNSDLLYPAFDVGKEFSDKFIKVHFVTDQNKQQYDQFNGIKIKIDFDISDLALISALFLRKNVYYRDVKISRNEYSLEVYTKVIEFLKECIAAEQNSPRLESYDYTITFKDTFNIDFLIDLYVKINNTMPTQDIVAAAKASNKSSQLMLDCNHACVLAQMTLSKEIKLGLKEENRFWSVVDVYQSTPQENLYQTISNLITPANYGILYK